MFLRSNTFISYTYIQNFIVVLFKNLMEGIEVSGTCMIEKSKNFYKCRMEKTFFKIEQKGTILLKYTFRRCASWMYNEIHEIGLL